jgi:GNAT superfamily N-acetyltransferase
MTGPQYATRPARPEDADFVYRVSEATMRAYAEATFGIWSEQIARDSFIPATHRILHYDGKDIGCIELLDLPEAVQLNKLYILPAWQHQGIGTRILNDIKTLASARNKPLRLRVLRVNPARRLYERLGFRIEHETPERLFLTID